MYRSIVSVVLMSLFLFACSNDTDVLYDYLDVSNTVGLVVEPSNRLQFEDKNLGDVLKYTLYFSPEELTLIGIDNEVYGNSFENNPSFNLHDCHVSVASYGYCSISIKMLSTANKGDVGSIMLMFSYNLDTNPETINKIKYHKLSFVYDNDSNPADQNSSEVRN